MSIKDWIPIRPSAANTANGASREFPEIAGFNRAVCYLKVSAATGTTPTLDVVIEELDPSQDPTQSTSWFPIATFTQVTGTSVNATWAQRLVFDVYGMNIRARWTVGGSSPNHTFGLTMIAGSEETWT